jgi:hypothetical protein
LVTFSERFDHVERGEGVVEKREAGIIRLFIIVIFFSASILLINKSKKNVAIATHIDVLNIATDSVGSLSCDDAYGHMNALLMSHDTDLIVKIINQFINHCATQLVEKIIQDTSLPLSHEEKMEILFGTVAHCGGKKAVQYRLLDFLLEHPHLYAQTPALLVLAQSKYNDSVPIFISWGKERQKVHEGLLSGFVSNAFEYAIEKNDYVSVEAMLSKKIRISQSQASELLWHVVKNDKNSSFVSLLVHHAQADVNYVNDGKTLLIEAVEQNNTKMVQVLLDEGAVVDRVVDAQKGTALAIAMMHKFRTTEQLLREYGA